MYNAAAVAREVNLDKTQKEWAKAQVIACVDVYKKTKPADYAHVVRKVKAERQALRDPKYARMEGNTSFEGRLAYTLPEELEYAITGALLVDPDDEGCRARSKWFKSGDGADWFCRRFPEFSFPQET